MKGAALDLKQLAALVTVADVGSVTKAAKLLHLVQPAVTRQIRLLEEEIGVPLFRRTHQGMVVTEAGEKLVSRARRVMHELERAKIELTPSPELVKGHVTIGVLESSIETLIQPLTDTIAKKHPAVHLQFVTGYSGHVREWIDQGDVDVAVLNSVSSTHALAVFPLLREQLWVLAPPDARLSKDTPMPWATVLAQPLVLPVGGLGVRAAVDQARSETGVQPTVVAESNSGFILKELVLARQGWCVLPAVAIKRDIDRGTLSGAPLVEPDITREVVLAFQRGGRTPPQVEAVATELIRVVHRLVRTGEWPGAEMHPDAGVALSP
jgi:LysR family transcriptional regulator, nitrogen assimilation regulatory protein